MIELGKICVIEIFIKEKGNVRKNKKQCFGVLLDHVRGVGD
jgi:hypothetical protein